MRASICSGGVTPGRAMANVKFFEYISDGNLANFLNG